MTKTQPIHPGAVLAELVDTVADLRREVADRLWATGPGHIRDPAVATAVDVMTRKLRDQSQQIGDLSGSIRKLETDTGQTRTKMQEVYTTTVAMENKLFQLANVLRVRAAMAPR